MSPLVRLGLVAAAGLLIFSGKKGDVSNSVSLSSGKDFFKLAQGDPRWATMLIGFSSESSADVGCFFTSLLAASNMLLGRSMTPLEAMPIVKAGGGFQPAQGASLFLPQAALALGVSAPETERIRAGVGTLDSLRAKADDILKRGGLPIFNVGYNSPSPRHFVLCNRRGPSGYECMDVAGPTATLMNIDAATLQGQRTASKRYVVCGVAGVFRRA
jgi:hypothetical protein